MDKKFELKIFWVNPKKTYIRDGVDFKGAFLFFGVFLSVWVDGTSSSFGHFQFDSFSFLDDVFLWSSAIPYGFEVDCLTNFNFVLQRWLHDEFKHWVWVLLAIDFASGVDDDTMFFDCSLMILLKCGG